MECDVILQHLRKQLNDMNMLEVSRISGITYPTVHAIATGKNDNPTLKVMDGLFRAIREIRSY